MAVFQPSRTIATCDECRAAFDPVNGGVCPSCRRLLCGEHYFGSLFRRLQAMVGGRPRCVACREGRAPAVRTR